MGLLDAIDKVLGTRIGLLVSDPRAAVNALESDARAFNQASLLATQAERNAARGLPVSPEQLAAKQYIDRKNEDLAMGFAGTTIGKPMLPSPKSLAMPDVPTVEQMKQYGRVEVVPLSKAVSFQSARNWEKFNAGKHPGDLVAGYGDKPLALRLETGEYVIYDGNHRADLALRKGKTELPMHVIDVKSYDPAHAGRKPVPSNMSDDEILNILLGKDK
jgi:hypothetical protein